MSKSATDIGRGPGFCKGVSQRRDRGRWLTALLRIN
jgi:hypothetical protein